MAYKEVWWTIALQLHAMQASWQDSYCPALLGHEEFKCTVSLLCGGTMRPHALATQLLHLLKVTQDPYGRWATPPYHIFSCRTCRVVGKGLKSVCAMRTETARRHSLATRLLRPPKVTQDPYGAVAPPLYQTATFDQVSAVQCGPYDYTRSGNPTRDQLEAQMADLEVGCAFNSTLGRLSGTCNVVDKQPCRSSGALDFQAPAVIVQTSHPSVKR